MRGRPPLFPWRRHLEVWVVPLAVVCTAITAIAAIVISSLGVRRQATAEYVRTLQAEVDRLTARVDVLEKELQDTLRQLADTRAENVELMKRLIRATGGRRVIPPADQ